MATKRDEEYKHIPGIFLKQEYADLYPELFGGDRLVGEWIYDKKQDQLTRLR